MFFSCLGANNSPGKTTIVKDQRKDSELGLTNLKYLVVDTTTQLQSKYFDVEDSTFFGFDQSIADVSLDTDIGYVVFSCNGDYSLAFVDGHNGFQVIGITKIGVLNENEEFIQYLYPLKKNDELVFGIVKLIKDQVITTKAWKVQSNRRITQLNPKAVDFTDSYYADTD